jgi:hypothetical protein
MVCGCVVFYLLLGLRVQFAVCISLLLQCCRFMIDAPHVAKLLPPMEERSGKVLVTAVTNDGTNMAGKKEARSLHAMLLRILSIGKACQDPDFIMPLSLHDCGESGETNRATPSSSYLALHALCSPRIAFLPPVPSAPPCTILRDCMPQIV